jgi:hypothetical protein
MFISFAKKSSFARHRSGLEFRRDAWMCFKTGFVAALVVT